MIDNCKFYARLTNAVRRALLLANEAEYPIVKIYRNHFFIKHPFQRDKIKVYFNLEREEIWLDESLPKILQGHNVFGSNRLEMLCLNVIKLIYSELGVKFTQEEEQKILEAGIRLGRLDITCSFWLESPEMVTQVLEYLYEHFRAEGKAWSAYGSNDVETVYNQQHSTRVTDKCYNKGKELAVKGRSIPATVPQRQRILEIARYLLRFEVTFRAKELVGLGLNYADCWNADQVKAELLTRIKQFKFQGVIRPRLDVEELPGLTDNYRTFYRLWADGANLRKHRKYRTLHRIRNKLLEQHQVDIYRRAKTGCPVPLREVLDPGCAYYSAPKSLLRSGAIFTGRTN